MTFQMMRSGFVAKLVTGAVAILLTTTFAACGAQGSASSVTSSDTSSVAQETANADATSKKAEKKDEKKEVNPTSIGDMSGDAIKAKVTNGLGKDIRSFKIRKAGEADWKELLKENETIKAGGVVELGIAASEKGAKFDVALECVDNAQVTLDALELSLMSELTINVENSVGYATYKDAEGKEGTTKAVENDDSETKNAAQPQAEADANDGAANGAANEPSGEAYVEDNSYSYEEPSYTNNYQPQYDYSYSEPVADYSYSAPEPQAPAPQQESAPQQNTDACLGDVVLRN